jgi:hypothetical protein
MYSGVVPIAAGRETMLAVLLLPGCGATLPARNSLHYIVQFLDYRRRCKNVFLLESDNLLSFTCSVLDKDPVDPKLIDLLDPDPDLYYIGIKD